MIFDDVKVGDQFKEKSTGRLIKVTDLTEKGFNYTCEPFTTKLGMYSFGTIVGGQLYTKVEEHFNCWDFLYEKVLKE